MHMQMSMCIVSTRLLTKETIRKVSFAIPTEGYASPVSAETKPDVGNNIKNERKNDHKEEGDGSYAVTSAAKQAKIQGSESFDA